MAIFRSPQFRVILLPGAAPRGVGGFFDLAVVVVVVGVNFLRKHPQHEAFEAFVSRIRMAADRFSEARLALAFYDFHVQGMEAPSERL